MGWQTVRLPEGYTWKGFMQFLLSTLPEETRRNYLKKLTVSIEFWRTTGGCLAAETIQKLRDAGVSIEVINTKNYKTNKKPVRMDYPVSYTPLWDTPEEENVLPMWVADMDFRTAPAIIDALQKRVAHGIFGYTKVPEAYYDCLLYTSAFTEILV